MPRMQGEDSLDEGVIPSRPDCIASRSWLSLGRYAVPRARMSCVCRAPLGVLVVAHLLVLSNLPHNSFAQSQLFGSIDDPREQSTSTWWQSQSEFQIATGFSLIGPQWRSAALVDFNSRTQNTSIRLSSTVRAGLWGTYDPDTDELYDLLRIVDYARYRPARARTYIRIGSLDRTRLGNGHLVNFLSSQASWDERTVGAEVRFANSHSKIEAFTLDVTRMGLYGLRLTTIPLHGSSSRLGSLELGASLVQDASVRLETGEFFRGFEADVRVVAFGKGGFEFVPFASFAKIPKFGQGLLIGADLENDNFIDLARLHLRLALEYNSSNFVSGYFGSYYSISNPKSRILEHVGAPPVDIPLDDIARGNSVQTELRILIFERFEFWYAFSRYHGVQSLSEYHLRLFFLAPRFRLSIGQDRRGLRGFASLFGDLGDENKMRFEFDYQIVSSLWAQFEAHYTYRPVGDAEDLDSEEPLPTTDGFIVQRRFDPLLGLRFQF